MMILCWYIHWFWITLQCLDFVFTMPTEPSDINDSLVPVMLRPTGKSLDLNVGNHLNLIHLNKTISTIATSTTISATNSKIRLISRVSTTIIPPTSIQNTTALMDGSEDHNSLKESNVLIQPHSNAVEVVRTDAVVVSVSAGNESRKVVAMGYTNNSFEDERFTETLNDTYRVNITGSEQFETTRLQESIGTLNISQSSIVNSNLIDHSGLNVGSDEGQLSAAGITGITVGCVSVVGLLSAISFIFYRYRSFNRPEALNDYCSNLDSSGYIDDTSIRDNSEEMYSLDNDSFLNSLEAMTIQNYWTDKVKHTKL